MEIYNTLGRRLEEFVPRDQGRVGMYVCGPTVQSEPHLGHGRVAVVFDVVARYFEWRGFDVTYVCNVTDVEDKIIAAASEAGETMEERAARMVARFHALYEALGNRPPTIEPYATRHIPEMIEMIQALIGRGLAYASDNGDVYFRVRDLGSGYGKLSGRNVDDLRSGARIDVNEAKEDPLDFALWKAAKPGEPAWDAPWSSGRPGWHIECSAMASKYLGPNFDIHGGGSDLIFPHHENEIAQFEGATGEGFARYWMHNGMVNLGGEKMSKSTGHLVELADAVERYGGIAIRLLYLRAHYRSPLEFTDELMSEAVTALTRIGRFFDRAPRVDDSHPDPEVLRKFTEAMEADFGTPDAIGVVFDAIRDANRLLDEGGEADSLVAAVHEIVDVLGIRPPVLSEDFDDIAFAVAELAGEVGLRLGESTEATLDALIARRSEARATRDFLISDRIRDGLNRLGVAIEDGADGTRWYRV